MMLDATPYITAAASVDRLAEALRRLAQDEAMLAAVLPDTGRRNADSAARVRRLVAAHLRDGLGLDA
ncbi:hypothetical protein [Caenispirillum salinarum]|uniref:hypothetical protein n=1 Tax=Caenispirillum salinarum TaxID=859058 RepID=UPI00384DF3B0